MIYKSASVKEKGRPMVETGGNHPRLSCCVTRGGSRKSVERFIDRRSPKKMRKIEPRSSFFYCVRFCVAEKKPGEKVPRTQYKNKGSIQMFLFLDNSVRRLCLCGSYFAQISSLVSFALQLFERSWEVKLEANGGFTKI